MSTSKSKYTDTEYSVGKDTFKINMKMFKENRLRLVAKLKKDNPEVTTGIIFLNGGRQTCRYSSDTDNIFRQESFFQWAFGVRDPDIYGAIDIETGASILFVPQYPGEYVVWFGEIRVQEHYLRDYCVDEVYFEEDMAKFFQDRKSLTVYRLKGLNTDSKTVHAPAEHENLKGLELSYDDEKLWFSFVESRVIKTEAELEVLRYATKKSSEAHMEVMRKIRPGWMEYQAEALFQFQCYDQGGMRECAYTCISATGKNAAILHYGHAGEPNTRLSKDGDMCMFDMGGEYCCYAADISCSYPINGKFSNDQKIIYTAVYNAWKAVKDNAKAGVKWPDMHKLAEVEILKVLKDNKLIKGDLNDMMANRLGAVFMPHGLGHFIGLDVHDVGGYMDHTPKRSTLPGLRSLRTARTLEANQVITIEPGCYFVWQVIENIQNNNPTLSAFLNIEELVRFKDFGGIRIESDCVIHEDHCEDMCTVPRTIEEIEEFMKEGRENNSQVVESKSEDDEGDKGGK